MTVSRTPVKDKAKYFCKHLRKENPDYTYVRELFRHIRKMLNLKRVSAKMEKIPYIPSEEEITHYYNTIWKSRNTKHVIMVKMLMYTGVKVTELINIKISDIDLDNCQIKIEKTGQKSERTVPFPNSFKEILAVYLEKIKETNGKYLFESSWNRSYTDRGIRLILRNYTKKSGIKQSISPKSLRHFLFTWMKKKGVKDSLIQAYSGSENLKSLGVYSQLSLEEQQPEYEKNIKDFPV